VTSLVGALADEAVAEEAAEALGRIGPEAAASVPALTAALDDERGDVRRVAARALGRIGLPAHASAPALVRALDDPRPPVRLMAARALPRVVGDPAEAMGAVEARLDVEREQDVRQELESARRKLRRRGGGR
jgi:HEAT repeat protein